MANDSTANVITIDSTGEVYTKGKGIKVLWIMVYLDGDDDTIEITDASGGKSHFKYSCPDVSVLGNYHFFYLGGQVMDGVYISTLTADCKAWIGTK